MKKDLRVGIIGCGTIGQYVLDFLADGKIQRCKPVAVYIRSKKSKGREHIESRKIPWVTEVQELLALNPDVVLEAASHEAVKKLGVTILSAGVDFVPMSLGAFVDCQLLMNMTEAAIKGKSMLNIPSGGIGALDALQAAALGGLDRVTLTTRNNPITWKGIPEVKKMEIDMENIMEPILLFQGPARECVKLYPQNINIAAALSIAGLGFDKTIIKLYADPFVKCTNHEIVWEGTAGKVTVIFENKSVPWNPETNYQPCFSALSVLKNMSGVRTRFQGLGAT